MRIALLAAALAAASFAADAQYQMYKCIINGKTAYQAEPCPETATQGTVKAPPAGPAAAPKAAPGAKASAGATSRDPVIDNTIDFMATYRACADGVKTWGEEMGPLYQQWRSSNSNLVSRVENEPALQAQYQERVKAKHNGPAGMCGPVGRKLRGVS
jgi:hypothetical protein